MKTVFLFVLFLMRTSFAQDLQSKLCEAVEANDSSKIKILFLAGAKLDSYCKEPDGLSAQSLLSKSWNSKKMKALDVLVDLGADFNFDSGWKRHNAKVDPYPLPSLMQVSLEERDEEWFEYVLKKKPAVLDDYYRSGAFYLFFGGAWKVRDPSSPWHHEPRWNLITELEKTGPIDVDRHRSNHVAGDTLLFWAWYNDDRARLEYLLRAGADLHAGMLPTLINGIRFRSQTSGFHVALKRKFTWCKNQ